MFQYRFGKIRQFIFVRHPVANRVHSRRARHSYRETIRATGDDRHLRATPLVRPCHPSNHPPPGSAPPRSSSSDWPALSSLPTLPPIPRIGHIALNDLVDFMTARLICSMPLACSLEDAVISSTRPATSLDPSQHDGRPDWSCQPAIIRSLSA